MGYPTLPTAFDLKNRGKFQPPAGSEELVRYLIIEFNKVYENSDLSKNGALRLSLDIVDDFNCEINQFVEYLTLLGYFVAYDPLEYYIIIRW